MPSATLVKLQLIVVDLRCRVQRAGLAADPDRDLPFARTVTVSMT
jgi:hypothetical protein